MTTQSGWRSPSRLLENKGNLKTMPQEVKGLASDYLEEILKQQQSLHSE